MFQRSSSSRRSSQGTPQVINWDQVEDPNCVAEPGWDTEPARTWSLKICRQYVKMTHLAKIWPRAQMLVSGPRWEGPTTTCERNHFRQRYWEVHDFVGLPNSKPTIMKYGLMSMVWAEIVLHKDVDWSTVGGKNVERLNRSQNFIATNWIGPSDCLPQWSNRTANATNEVVPDDDTSQWEVRPRNTYRQRDVENYPLTFGTAREHDYENHHGTSHPVGRGYHRGASHGYDDNAYAVHNDERVPYPDRYSTPRAYSPERTHNDFGHHGFQSHTPIYSGPGESSASSAPVTFGRDMYSAADGPPDGYAAGPSSQYHGDDEYERDLQEAIRRSEEEENERRMIEQRFFEQQWDAERGTFRGDRRY
jgi:hypothetical protein